MSERGRILPRLKSCLETIIDVRTAVEAGFLEPGLTEKFCRLEKFLQVADLTGVSEQEISLVEEAVNRLLKEWSIFSREAEAGKPAALN
ncbi:MAG: hypothetical protein V1816_18890 [Pseudomonadota bacterium]